ncbi:MAG: hypothetical protein AB7P04_14765 [Bacteriovoracia bacterium]
MSTKTSIFASAPSNIAIIKYMGKKDASQNLPANGSLSMTLNSLQTVVEFERMPTKGKQCVFRWIPELPRMELEKLTAAAAEKGAAKSAAAAKSRAPQSPWMAPALNDHGVTKVNKQIERVQRFVPEVFGAHGLQFDLDCDINWRTCNSFPAAAGIASSASSFAAITLAAAATFARDVKAFEKVWQTQADFRRAFAALSRQGSGSSCRSLEGPWVKWEGERAAAVTSKMPEMVDFVLLVSRESKQVSSSEAHLRVLQSPLWTGRVDRVAGRMTQLETALASGDLTGVAKIAWAEAWEMHSLFHTCERPFTYFEPRSIEILKWLATLYNAALDHNQVPPIVTLDAGPNVHLLVAKSKAAQWRELLTVKFPDLEFLEDPQGDGAKLLS